MEAPKSLRRPSNWQDFESLCKKLWGEIWSCQEIAKNGRPGQTQHGVDVYGMPEGESQYYGIQCKGKDEYTQKQFTNSEIDIEIDNAKHFKPLLKKLYLVTTAVKDAKIEQYVREKNIENITNGLFTVHIYSWEDIVDLIDENKQTHDWYVTNHKYKLNQGVDVSFADGSKVLLLTAKFKKEYINYGPRIVPDNHVVIGAPMLADLFNNKKERDDFRILSNSILSKTITNLSFVGFSILLTNTGTAQIENFVLKLELNGTIEQVASSNIERTGVAGLLPKSIYRNVFINEKDCTVDIKPIVTFLVSGNSLESDDIFIKPTPENTQVTIKWTLLSKDYKQQGELLLKIQTDIEAQHRTVLVSDPLTQRFEEGKIEDFLVEEPS
jgi:hypothetical protein